jgi:hypothetical protein
MVQASRRYLSMRRLQAQTSTSRLGKTTVIKKISCMALASGLLFSPNAALAGGWHGGWGGHGWHGGYYARPFVGYCGYGGACWRWWYGRWVWAC